MIRELTRRFGGLGRPFWALQVGLLLNRAGQFVQPLLTFWLTTVFSLSVTGAGAVVAVYGLGGTLGATLGGVLADRYGRRFVMLLSAAGATVTLVALAGAQHIGAFTLALAYDLHRPAVYAMVADLVPPRDRIRAFSLTYVTVNVGFAVAPALAGWIAGYSYPAVFLAAAAVQVAWALFVVRGLTETQAAPHPDAPPSRLRDALNDRVFVMWLAAVALASLVPHQGFVALAAWMKHQGHAASTFGAVLGLNGLLIVLIQPWVSPILTSLDPPRVMAVGCALQGLGFALHGLQFGVPGHVFAVVVWTSGEIIASPLYSAVVASLAPAALRARYQGLLGMAFSFAGVVGPLVGAAVLDQWGAALWAGCLVVGVAAGGAMLRLGPALRGRLDGAR